MELIVAALAERFKHVHRVLREEIIGLTVEQLAYVPAPGANSLAVLVTHTLGSEAQAWALVSGRDTSRDRLSEFTNPATMPDDLLARLDRADRLIDEIAPTIDATALATEFTRESDGATRTGAHWLIHNFGHASEHVAHVQLTKQLLPDHYPPPARPW